MKLDRPQAVLYLALFLQQSITNFSESHWFNVLSIDFLLITLATMALARGLLDHRLRTAFGEPGHGLMPIHDENDPARRPVPLHPAGILIP